jgi:hypothetical protein
VDKAFFFLKIFTVNCLSLGDKFVINLSDWENHYKLRCFNFECLQIIGGPCMFSLRPSLALVQVGSRNEWFYAYVIMMLHRLLAL